jgi:hypothetical protein
MHQAAAAFLATLEPEQVKKAVFPFNSDERLNWHYVPRERQGLCFKEMTGSQREAALRLLRVGLSQRGIGKAETIRSLENVLREIEQGSGPVRDPELYYFSLFGEPSESGTWGWRYEGHHVSLHWTFVQGQVIASTPQFLGANPAEVRFGPLQGTRVLAAEEDLGRALALALDAVQRAEAILSETAPPDIVTRAERRAAILEDRGIAYRDLNPEQQGMLLALIQEHACAQTPELAGKRLDAVRAAGLDDVKFAWMGSLERRQGHYYRVQGAAFLIEYDNTQNDANHVHTVWRDFEGDFGLDLLEKHYREFRHTPKG